MTAPDVYASARQSRLTRLASRFASRSRKLRYDTFVKAVHLGDRDRVLDVGCGRLGLRAFDDRHEIVGLDAREQPSYPGELVVGDALAIPFADGSFDVAYCNSLIEHVRPQDRERLASEIRRVSERWFVQTPNRWFPVEPHVLLPLFQFLPRFLQKRLWRFGVAGPEYEEISLLGARELQALFPDALILRERVGPLTKSLMAVGPRDSLRATPPSGATSS